MRRVLIAGLTLALVAPACGDSGADSSATTVPSGEAVVGFVFADPELIALAESLATDAGADAVFGAVALALDNGYAVAQLADSAGQGLLAPDGTVFGIEPDQEPYGLLSTDGLDLQSFRAPPPGVSIEQLKAALVPVDDFNWRKDLDSDLQDNVILAGALLALVEMGYAYDQVVEGLIFGELNVRFATEYKSYSSGSELNAFGCLALVDAAGTILKPERELVPGSAAVGRAYQCGRLARDGGLLTEDQARAELAGESEQATEGDVPEVVGNPVGGSEQGQVTDGRYVGSLDDPGSIFDVEVGDDRVEVVVEGGSVTELSLGSSGRYSACLGGYGNEDEVSCTVWLTWDIALSSGPVVISDGSTDVPMTATQVYADCESELASECEDWDYTEVDEVNVRISITEETITGSILAEGQDIGAGFTATRQ